MLLLHTAEADHIQSTDVGIEHHILSPLEEKEKVHSNEKSGGNEKLIQDETSEQGRVSITLLQEYEIANS